MNVTVTTWTCDRCGATVETDQGEQPKDWSAVKLTGHRSASLWGRP